MVDLYTAPIPTNQALYIIGQGQPIDPSGTIDNSAAFQAELNIGLGGNIGGIQYNQKKIIWPPGNFMILTPLSINGAVGVVMEGDGTFSTTIRNPNGTGIFNCSGYCFSSLGNMGLVGAGGVPNLFGLNTTQQPNGYNVTLTPNAAISPDGTLDAYLMANTLVSNQAVGIQDYGGGSGCSGRIPNFIANCPPMNLFNSTTYTVKIWAKPNASNFLLVSIADQFGLTGSWATATFNLTTGAVGETNSAGGTVIAAASAAQDGGYWCWLTFQLTSASNVSANFSLLSVLTGNNYASNNGYVPVSAAANALSAYIFSPQIFTGANAVASLPADTLILLEGGAGFNTQASDFYNLGLTSCYDGIASGPTQCDTSTLRNPYINECSHAGLALYNYNALGWNVYGGNALQNLMAVFVYEGSVSKISGLNSELNTCDIVIGNSAGDGIAIDGFRTESQSVCMANTGTINLSGIHHSPPSVLSTDIFFWGQTREPTTIESCNNYSGVVKMGGGGVIIGSNWGVGFDTTTTFPAAMPPVHVRACNFNGIYENGDTPTFVANSITTGQGVWYGDGFDFYSFSQLPPASTTAGTYALIFDSPSLVVGSIVTVGGGSNGAILISNGTSWVIWATLVGGSVQAGNGFSTVTISNATPAVVTLSPHGMHLAQPLQFFVDGGTLPTGITAGTIYFAIPTGAGTFNIATSVANALAGTKVATSSAGSGTFLMFAAGVTMLGTTGAQGINIQGGVTTALTKTAGAYAVLLTDYTILATAAGVPTFPTAVGIMGQKFVFKNRSGASITPATTSSQTIDGSAPAAVTNNSILRIQSDGANWFTW